MSTQPPSSRLAQRLWLASALPVLLLAVLFSGFAAISRLDYARHIDEASRAMTERLVSSALAARREATEEVTLDFAHWNDAYAAISLRWNPQWLERNYYSSVLDALIVFRGGQLRYLWTAENLETGPGAIGRDAMAAARSAPELSQLARANGSPKVVSMLTSIGGNLALVGMAAVSPEDERTREALDRNNAPRDYVLAIRLLDAAQIAELGAAMNLRDLRFETTPDARAPNDSAWPIAAPNGDRIGDMVWRDDRPGEATLTSRIASAVGLILTASLLAILAMRFLIFRIVERTPAT
jgi:sensor domain CHASE-containing protein